MKHSHTLKLAGSVVLVAFACESAPSQGRGSAMRRSYLNLTCSFCLTVLMLASVAFGQGGGSSEIYFVPDVIGQFNQLALRPDGLAFGLGNSPDPDIHKHYQGIVRKHGPGTPYLFVSRSGNDVPECVTDCAPEPGNLVIVRMGSRDTNGERLRSNRLVRDWAIASFLPTGSLNLWPTPPDARDTAVATILFNGENGWPSYGHPGGMQLVGDVLVVPLTVPYPDIPFPFPSPVPTPNPDKPKDLILFLDVSNPETPTIKSQFVPLTGDEFQAGQVALTPVLNPDGPGVRYLMLVAGKNNRDVRLYRSLPTHRGGSTDLKAPNLNWELVRSWSAQELQAGFCSQVPNCDVSICSMYGPNPPLPFPRDPDCQPAHEWPNSGSQAHQMFSLVRQESLDGPLFLIGARNTEPVLAPGGGEDFLDLYQVEVDRYGNPADRLLTHIESKHVATDAIGGGGDTSHFAGSTGVYISPTGELIVYASQHNNEGPPELLPGGEPGRRTVRFGEWRHREMVRPGSPTLSPTVEALGPFEVDEGSAVILSARGKGPITKAWLQLFEDDGLGLTDNFDDNDWLAVDYQDWNKDDFDDFTKLLWYFNDEAGSWRWFAPEGCTLRVNDHSFGDSNFPGRRKKLFGNGMVKEEADLDAVQSDNGGGSMDNKISSVQFFPTEDEVFPDCRVYYNAPINVTWDFDLNGAFETFGENPTLSASELDGPSLQSVPVRAQHATDPTPLGQGAPAAVDVRVRNVAPHVTSFALVDSRGFEVGLDLPFALVNVEYVAEGSFTDPGRPDHQAAHLNLGDGTTISSSAFASFSDAFGGATGRLRQGHTYGTPGTYALRLEVTDDDGGQTAASTSVNVATPIDAVQWVIGEIDLLLAGATGPAVTAALRDARDNLAGNNNGAAHNGALDKLADGNLVAALVKIKAAISALQRAEAAGAGDLSRLKCLLGLTGEAVAQGAYLEAVAAVASPSPGQAIQLQRIRQSITNGQARLVDGEYSGALDLFKDAVSRARALW